jgi:hypothetical protein
VFVISIKFLSIEQKLSLLASYLANLPFNWDHSDKKHRWSSPLRFSSIQFKKPSLV